MQKKSMYLLLSHALLYMRRSNFHLRLILTIGLFFITLLAIVFGIRILQSSVSESFVFEHSIKNAIEEAENSSQTQRIVSDNEEYLVELGQHAVATESDVPLIVEEMESYGDALKLIVKINSIAFPDPKLKKSKPPTEEDIELSKKEAEKTAAGTASETPAAPLPKSGKPLTVEIAVRGDFAKLVSFLKVLENGRYIVKIPAYSLRQVVVTPPTTAGGEPVIVDLKDYISAGQQPNITWLLNARLVVYTRIQ